MAEAAPSSWEAFLTERDRQVFSAAGYGARGGLGNRPALLLIDVTYAFCGDRPEPILTSIERWRNSSGEEAWAAIAVMRRLIDAARAAQIPTLYSRGPDSAVDLQERGRWSGKNSRGGENSAEGNRIVAEIAPRPGDHVIKKNKPSVFFGTDLASRLIDLGVDSLIVGGGTTSGCVRASVVDAFSYNYRVAVVREATFDRGQASHSMNLFDMHMKYADVITSHDALDYLGRCRNGTAQPTHVALG